MVTKRTKELKYLINCHLQMHCLVYNLRWQQVLVSSVSLRLPRFGTRPCPEPRAGLHPSAGAEGSTRQQGASEQGTAVPRAFSGALFSLLLCKVR